MTFDEFTATLKASSPPASLRPALIALWYDGAGDWERAHLVAQDIHGPEGAWIHAYLHRQEGDASNAAYWYGQARQPVATDALRVEWERLVRALL